MLASATASSSAPLLAIEHLETRFGRRVVHKDLSLDLHEGEVLVLLGGSGSGKSTLLRTLIGLETPSGGSCRFEDEDLYRLEEPDWQRVRRRIAYAFQGGALFDSLTVAENLSYPLLEHTELSEAECLAKVTETLERFGLAGTEKLLPASLSGGMQKRVGLARAIMLDPRIILYDEPTAGLDPTNGRKIAETILALKAAGKTSILVTHDTACALAVADRIAFIHEGKIAAVQTRDEVLRAPAPLIDAYLKGEDQPSSARPANPSSPSARSSS
jgi:phospholipid/cholesterol/gamma-HCH transport system ATP-binding protein